MPALTLEAGNSYGYSLTMPDNSMSGVLNENVWSYSYTGNFQHFVAPKDGAYKLEAWGAGQYKGGSVTGGVIACPAGATGYARITLP
jgi:hypothetical protein